ncbi:MAG: ABC transporter substrate-binding protein [Leptolyngbyaceae cyanobacterium bins.59]|nr:ABC transporter substrate-binding protein [Leptolyngbyaceae cyanobacterium bins.59]
MNLVSSLRSPLLLTCSIALLSSCSPSPAPQNSPVSSLTNAVSTGVLVYGAGGQPVNLEPGNIVDGNSIMVQEQIYDRLLDFKPGTTDPIPSLATAWSVSPDGKTWTFKLRSGVKFHDGTALDAAAVKFNVERWWNPQHPHGYRNAGKGYNIWQELFGGFKGDAASVLKEVRTPDPLTVEFVLSQPFAAFPVAIGSGYFGIASPAAIQKAGASYGTAGSIAVGTGAYRFKEWRTGDRIVLEKNPDYWETGFPKMNQVVIRFITDPSARLAQLRAGQVDFTVDLAPDQLKEIQADPNLEAIPRPSFNVGYLALNPSYPPLAKVEVRRAIAHAINRPAIVQAFWGDLGVSDPHFIPPSLSRYQPKGLVDYDYNPQKAKQLLTQAGYANGFDLDLWYMPVSRPYFPTPKPIAEAFAADLSAVGIRVRLQTKDWAAYLNDRRKAPGFQSFMLGWNGDYGDPDNFYYSHFGPGSTGDLGNWRNDRLLQLLNQGRATRDPATRTRLYREVGEILYREIVRLPIVHSQPLLAKRKNLQGWTPSPLGSEPLKTVFKD